MRILVIDDLIKRRNNITSLLQQLGYKTISKPANKEALEAYTIEKPDLIIITLASEQKGNITCAKTWYEMTHTGNIPILFLVNAKDEKTILERIPKVYDCYLLTPFSPTSLVNAIRRLKLLKKIHSDSREFQISIQKLTSTDLLTGLNNRLKFKHMLQEAFVRAGRKDKIALFVINLDNFKLFNYYEGNDRGDLLLKEVAVRLHRCLRPNDLLARLGSDEFAIVLTNISRITQVKAFAQNILKTLTPMYNIQDTEALISCSIGIALYPGTCENVEDLFNQASIAMRYAKKMGRNTYQYYDIEQQLPQKNRFYIENALRRAISNQEILMYYQPVFELCTKKLVGMEALMRWNNPQYGLIMPDSFIPIAEDSGLINDLGGWALKHVFKQAAKWYREGYRDYKYSINISLKQLLHSELIQLIKDSLQETGLPPELIELELTESSLMPSLQRTEKIIKDISAMHLGIALDDFGTGFSSLTHLKNLPITSLKIDKEFVMGVYKNTTCSLLVKSIITLSQLLKINVVAEGIHTKAQLEFLIKSGCPFGQGFYLSKPLSTEKMTAFLQKSSNNIVPRVHK